MVYWDLRPESREPVGVKNELTDYVSTFVLAVALASCTRIASIRLREVISREFIACQGSVWNIE
jgi:hypothetical protein